MITLQEALASGRGVERAFHCHVHDNTNTPAASVNVAMGVWVCYSCGAAGRTDGKLSRSAEVTELAAGMLVPAKQSALLSKPAGWLELFDAHHPSPYWVNRVGRETAELYRCGTHPTTFNPTYPVTDIQGRVLGVVQRQTGTPKYVYPPGISVSECLFGFEYAKSQKDMPLVVVEGASDVMAVHAKTGICGVGVYGAGIKTLQLNVISKMRRRVVIAFDADRAGQHASMVSRQALEEKGIQANVITWPPDVKDAADVDAVQLAERIRNCADG